MLLPLLVVFSLAPQVRAQDESEEARELFVQGVEASGDERWGEAVDFFRRSRAILERPSAVFNTAVALHRMGRVREALADVVAYLDMTTARAEGERARYAQAQLLRTELRELIAVLTLTVTPPDAQVEVDGRARDGSGTEREIDLDPGSHAIRVSAEGHAPQQLELSLSPGQQESREVTLEAGEEEIVEEPGPGPEPLPSDEGGLGDLGTIGIIIAGVGAAAGIGALITGLVSQDMYDSLVARCNAGGICPAGSEGDISTGEALAWTSTILLGVSIIGIGLGVALLIVDLVSGDSGGESAVRVVPVEGGAGVRLAF